jgi:hypothetical protein
VEIKFKGSLIGKLPQKVDFEIHPHYLEKSSEHCDPWGNSTPVLGPDSRFIGADLLPESRFKEK